MRHCQLRIPLGNGIQEVIFLSKIHHILLRCKRIKSFFKAL